MHPTSIYARRSLGTGHHRRYMAGLSLSAPVQSTSKQKDNTTMFPPRGLPPKPHWRPRQNDLPLPPHRIKFASNVPLRCGGCGAGCCRRPRGGLPRGEGCVDPGGLPAGVGTKPPRNGHGWGFVSPRHLGHGFLRNKSKTFLFPRVPEKRPSLVRLGPCRCSREGGSTGHPKTQPKVKSAARAPRGWTVELRYCDSDLPYGKRRGRGLSRAPPDCDTQGHRSRSRSRPDWVSGLNPFGAFQRSRAPRTPCPRGRLTWGHRCAAAARGEAGQGRSRRPRGGGTQRSAPLRWGTLTERLESLFRELRLNMAGRLLHAAPSVGRSAPRPGGRVAWAGTLGGPWLGCLRLAAPGSLRSARLPRLPCWCLSLSRPQVPPSLPASPRLPGFAPRAAGSSHPSPAPAAPTLSLPRLPRRPAAATAAPAPGPAHKGSSLTPGEVRAGTT